MIIYVSGFPQSGTTLLQGVLCMSKGSIPLLGEVSFPQDVALSFVRQMRTWDDDSKYFFSDFDQLKDFYRGILSNFEQMVSTRYGNRENVVLKHPRLTHQFPILRRIRPTDRFIAVVRDPRDVTISIANRAKKAGNTLEVVKMSKEVAACWREAYITLLNDHYDYLIVRYEDLVLHYNPTREKLEETIGCPIEGDLNSVWDHAKFDFLVNSKTLEGQAASKYWGKPVTSERIGAYKRKLTGETCTVIEHTCGDLMKHFDYL